ncbi:RNA ligase family protein [Aneurinibacillus sp. Ricciae_BoGa-3]|uniref:ATP-dependent DNA ligase n=1 Tax=Aneurinibacillus sp. Ricciae_BoGa-3 TaxID=3022697 RepID=UPI0023421B4F|nr:RNA ligase family protein [Aneurinibacillus sp. Ricciae_BoGa-3]WCK56117.1 RNA ligase family protein [Aneurinibacillus sp. Ricciae_BoGa-3]
MQLTPIVPFEPVLTETIPEGHNWIAQIKWDGVRILTYCDGKEVRLFNRKRHERTFHYPELSDIKSYCQADSVILDGEVIALGLNGKPSFHEVMRRDGIRRMEKVAAAEQQVPITYMIFDVIYCNGQWLNILPLKERIEILSNIIVPNDRVQLVSIHHDAENLFDVMKKQQMEGIVVKDLNSKYFMNSKNAHWKKKKFYKDVIAVVGGVTFSGGIVNAILLGLYDDDGQLTYIGHSGTGRLTKEEWREFTDIIQPLKTAQNPFKNDHARFKDAVWLIPEITVKIRFMEWTSNATLRQPSIQSFIPVDPKTCTFE